MSNTEELQADVVDENPSVAPETGSESAPETEEKLTFDDKQQAFINDLAGKKTRQIRDAERETERFKQELAEVKAKLPKSERPSVPDMPDPYDENFESLAKQRDEAVQKAAAYDADQRVLQERGEAEALHRQQTQQKAIVDSVTEYSARAIKLGVSKDELQIAGQAVAEYGLSNDITQFILDDEEGPLITTYLAKNPVELDSLRGLTPLQAAVRIASTIKPNAVAMKKTPGAPPPADILSGQGTPPGKRGPKGATFK